MQVEQTVKKYDTYKDSGIEWIGEIPQHWVVQKLKQLVSTPLQYGANESGNVFDENLPRYIRITDIKIEDNSLKEEGKLSLSIDKAKDYILHDGDILFARSGATVGKTFLYKSEYGLSAFAGYLIRATIKKTLNPKYIYYFTLSNSYEEWKNRIFIQATIQNIGANKYNNLEISLPLLDEQNDIVKYLDMKCGEIDRVVETEKTVIEKLKEYKQSIITEAVTKGLDKSVPLKDSGIEWIGKIPQHWETCKLLKLYKERKCKNKGNIETNVLSLSYGNIKKRNVENNMGLLPESFETYNIIVPDNIVLRLTDLQNDHRSLRCGLVKEQGIITSAYVTLEKKLDNISSNYYYRLLHTFDIMKGFYGMGDGVRQNLKYDGELCNLLVVRPPYAEQQQIAEYLDNKCSEIDRAIADKEQVIEKFTEYKKSLIYECVTGKRKVVT